MSQDGPKPQKLPPPSSQVHTHEISASPSEPWEVLPATTTGGVPELSPYQQFRFSGCLPLREKLRRAMEEAGQSAKTLTRYDSCGAHAHLYTSASTGKHSIRGDFCKCRTCIPCGVARARLISSNLIDFLGDRHTRMTTLTIKHNNAPLETLITRVWRSFKLLRNEPEFDVKMRGWAAFLEVKWSTRSNWWHVHLHILSEGSWWDQRELSSTWHKCTGDSFIVDIQAKGTNASRAYYASKYASKPFDAGSIPDFEKLTDAVRNLHRRKLWQVGGTWKPLRLLAKPKCTITDWVYACSLNTLFNDAREGNPHAKELVSQLLCADEERTLVPPNNSS